MCKHIRKYRKRRKKRRSITDTHNTAEDERSGKREDGGRRIRKRDDDSWLYGARRACVNGDRRKQRVRVGEVGRKADSTKTTKRAMTQNQTLNQLKRNQKPNAGLLVKNLPHSTGSP